MAEYEQNAERSDDWYTPPAIFEALNLQFDLDPCSPGKDHWVPANAVYTKSDNGLVEPWSGSVFMNPPFGARHSHVPWLVKFLEHGDGIAIVRAYTSADWFHDYAIKADAILFPKGKTKFVRPNGTIGGSPGHGVAFLAMGETCCSALMDSGLGLYVPLAKPTANA